jgi:hypothetical protein
MLWKCFVSAQFSVLNIVFAFFLKRINTHFYTSTSDIKIIYNIYSK